MDERITKTLSGRVRRQERKPRDPTSPCDHTEKPTEKAREGGRKREISVEMVLREGKANGPEDCIVPEMLKELPLETVREITKYFNERYNGTFVAPPSWKKMRFIFLKILTERKKRV